MKRLLLIALLALGACTSETIQLRPDAQPIDAGIDAPAPTTDAAEDIVDGGDPDVR